MPATEVQPKQQPPAEKQEPLEEPKNAPPPLKRGKSVPKLAREKYFVNKIYRAPPTPPLERQYGMEKSFTLDCIATSNISTDYSKANPKLGSVIPPYDSFNDPAVTRYLNSFAVRDLINRNNLSDNHESIAGKAHDNFFKSGVGFRYLEKRNQFGNGHHPETYEGHRRFMSEEMRVMTSYNNMYGYRRNIPKLRVEPCSTFSLDPRWYDRIQKTYGEHFKEDELLEHFKNTFMIGYPFWDNNYNNFHPSVKYVITVKTSEHSPAEYKGNLGINLIARSFDTGFIKLDSNIAYKSGKAKTSENKDEEPTFFKRGQTDKFQFEDQDIRTISAAIVSCDIKGDEILYLEYFQIEIIKPHETQTFRFPFDAWVRTCKQDKKTEDLKSRFGKKNSVIVYPNEKPMYEYAIRVAPQMANNTEYTVQVAYDVKSLDAPVDYTIDLDTELPTGTKLIIRFSGELGESEIIKLDDKTKSVEADNRRLFKMTGKDIGELKNVSLLYKDKQRGAEYALKNFRISNTEGYSYLIEMKNNLRSEKERTIKSKLVSYEPPKNQNDDPPSTEGSLLMRINGSANTTSLFPLKNVVESKKGVHTFKKNQGNVGNIKDVQFRFEGENNQFCRIKSVHITSNKGHDFTFDKMMTIRNNEDMKASDKSKSKPASAVESQTDTSCIYIQIIGDKKSTDLFQLKGSTSNDDTTDEFHKSDNDLGLIKNVYVKNWSKRTKVIMQYIEIIDPRGNSFKFVMDATLQGGEDMMLPRKSGRSGSQTSQGPKTVPEPEKPKPTQKEPPATKPAEKPAAKPAEKTAAKPAPAPAPKPADASNKPVSSYKVEVKTCDETGAGTDSNVFISIFGTNGELIDIPLKNSQNNKDPFESGYLDSFQIDHNSNLGKIERVKIGTDGKGLAAPWKLEFVRIVVDGNTAYTFTANKWIDKDTAIKGQKLNQIELKADGSTTGTATNSDNKAKK